MTAPASPPVAVGVEDAVRLLESRCKAIDAHYERFPTSLDRTMEDTARAIRTVLRALASPVSGDGSSADADTHRAAVPPVVGWQTVAREALECIAAAKQTSMKTPNTYAGGFDAGCHWASGVAERALAKLPQPAASFSPGMETLQASECTKEGDQ